MPYKNVKNLYNFLFILILGTFWSISVPVLATDNNLFISEINFRGSLSSGGCIQANKTNLYEKNTNWCGKDQWLEIYNPTKENINLTGWSIEFRGGKTTSLEGFSVNPNATLVMVFNQQNFISILPNKNLASYNLLYLSSESGKEETSHNITAILKKNGKIIDQINTHPSTLDLDYLNTRGRSFFKCQKEGSWQKTTQTFDDQGQNFGTPGFLDQNCPKIATIENSQTPKAPSIENILPKENIPSINQTQPINQVATELTTNLQNQTSSIIEQTTVEQILPTTYSEKLQQVPAQNAINTPETLPHKIQNPQIKVETNFSAESSFLNLKPVQKSNFTLLKSQYQSVFTSSSNEEMLILNFLTLTGLVFSLTKKVLKFNFKTQL